MKLYDDPISGNGYKVRLLLAQLGRPFEYVPLDITKGETRTAAFLARNPNGRIPVLELDDGTCLPESNVILWYLAEGTPFLPDARLARAQTLQWTLHARRRRGWLRSVVVRGAARVAGAGPHAAGARPDRRRQPPERLTIQPCRASAATRVSR